MRDSVGVFDEVTSQSYPSHRHVLNEGQYTERDVASFAIKAMQSGVYDYSENTLPYFFRCSHFVEERYDDKLVVGSKIAALRCTGVYQRAGFVNTPVLDNAYYFSINTYMIDIENEQARSFKPVQTKDQDIERWLRLLFPVDYKKAVIVKSGNDSNVLRYMVIQAFLFIDNLDWRNIIGKLPGGFEFTTLGEELLETGGIEGSDE